MGQNLASCWETVDTGKASSVAVDSKACQVHLVVLLGEAVAEVPEPVQQVVAVAFVADSRLAASAVAASSTEGTDMADILRIRNRQEASYQQDNNLEHLAPCLEHPRGFLRWGFQGHLDWKAVFHPPWQEKALEHLAATMQLPT